MNQKPYNQPIVDAFGNPWIIYHKAETDNYDNVVTIIESCDGYKYRMVHHSKPFHRTKRFTIYAGRNKFIRCRITETDSDTQEDTMEIFNHKIAWGDGDNLGVTVLEGETNKELVSTLSNIHDNDYYKVIVSVVNHVETNSLWQSKENEVAR